MWRQVQLEEDGAGWRHVFHQVMCYGIKTDFIQVRHSTINAIITDLPALSQSARCNLINDGASFIIAVQLP